MTLPVYAVILGLVAAERVVELVVSRRNAAWSFARGGREHGRGHFHAMIALHGLFLPACLLEAWLGGRSAPPWWPVALPAAIAAQVLRWWCIRTLGPRWNTRVITVPGLAPVHAGPYRVLRHPNYVAVVIEGVALPAIHGAWITAAAFTLLNAALLTVRIRVEEDALDDAARSAPPP